MTLLSQLRADREQTERVEVEAQPMQNRGTTIATVCLLLRELPSRFGWEEVAALLDDDGFAHSKRTAQRWISALEAGLVIEKVAYARWKRLADLKVDGRNRGQA